MSVLGYGPGWRARLAKNPPSSRTGPIRADGSGPAMLTWRARSGRATFEAPLERARSVKSVRITCRPRAKGLRLVNTGKQAGGGWAQSLRAAHALTVTLDDHGEIKVVGHHDDDDHGREALRIPASRTRMHQSGSVQDFSRHSQAQAHVSGRR